MGAGRDDEDHHRGEPPPTEVDPDVTLDDLREVAARIPTPRRLLDRYELGALIGEGGMGEVRECRDVVLHRSVALKTVRRDRTALQLEARFVREACVQAQLEHPGVVPVYEVGRDGEGSAFFTMRKVEGITLERIIERKRAGDPASDDRFSRHRLLSAFAKICLTLDYAHANGVLHRDLKPANVMFGDFGEVYLLDWGIAKLTLEDAAGPLSVRGGVTAAQLATTMVGTALGTPAYMAPEQFAGRPIDARADVFSLGAVLFEILTLEPLLMEATLRARSAGGVPLWDARPSARAPERQVPPEFDRICVRATATAPEKRYASARELHDAIEAYLGGERDLELRQRLAATHIARAEDARVTDPDLALREVNRALALAPEEPRGLALLVDLLKATPASAEQAFQHVVSEGIARLRRAQPLGALLFVAPWLTVYPLVAALRGISDLKVALVPVAAWLSAGIAILIDHRRGSQERVVYPTVLIWTAVALTSLLLGPIFIVPALAVTVVANLVLVATRELRLVNTVLGCVAVAVPTAAASLGFHDVYHFDTENAFRITGIFATFRQGILCVSLGLVDVLMIVSTAIFAGKFRDQIDRARSENALFAWQLSKLLPAAASRTTGEPSAPELPVRVASDGAPHVHDTEVDGRPVSSRRGPPPSGNAHAPGVRGLLDVDGPRYVARAKLADDGITLLHECEDRLVGRLVAMKRLRPELHGRGELEPKLTGEALLQARLDHPGIPPVYDLGRDAHGPWFTTKVVRGSSFAEVLRTEGTSEQARQRHLAAFAQVCLTLDFAHQRGIVHRALEPDAVRLGEFGEVYVVGWDRAQAPSVVGIPIGASAAGEPVPRSAGYTAPEAAAGAHFDARADVFALGAILYEIIARQPLFGGDDPFAVVLGKYDARPSALGLAQQISPDLDGICARATAYDPDDRYPSARELHDAVEAFLGHDRDDVMRHALATERLAKATKSAERALRDNDEASRIDALREVGRALALAPDRGPALQLLERLLRTAPTPLPAMVVQELQAESWTMVRRATPVTTVTYVIAWTVIFPAIAVFAGVRDWSAVLAVVTAWVVAAVVLYMQGTRTSASRLPWSAVTGLSAVGLTSLVLGPNIIVPSAVVAMTLGYILNGKAEWRRTIVILACAAVVVPALLAWTHVLHIYDLGSPTPMGTFVLNGAIFHPPGKLLPVLIILNVAAVLVAAAYAARFRDMLERIEADNRAKVLALARLVAS